MSFHIIYSKSWLLKLSRGCWSTSSVVLGGVVNDMANENIPFDSEMIRPNYKIISSPQDPVYTSSSSSNNPLNPLVTTGLSAAFAQIGQYFTLNTGAQLSGANNYLYCQLALPARWTKEMHIDRIRAGTSSTSSAAIIEIRSLGTTPLGLTLTPVSPTNTNLLSSKTTLVTAGYASSSTNITSGSLLFSFIQGTGTSDLDLGGRVIAGNPTASTLYFYLKLSDSVNASSILSCSWWEDLL